MTKNITEEIEKLLKIKEEVDKINEAIRSTEKYEIVSQRMYDFLTSKNLLKSDTLYYITSIEVGQYIEGFRG